MAGHSLFSTVTRLVTVRSQFGNSCMANRVKTHSLELIDSIKKVRLNPSHPEFLARDALVSDDVKILKVDRLSTNADDAREHES